MIVLNGDKYNYIDANYDRAFPVAHHVVADKLNHTLGSMSADFKRALPLVDCVQVDLLPDLWVKWSITSIDGVPIKRNLVPRLK